MGSINHSVAVGDYSLLALVPSIGSRWRRDSDVAFTTNDAPRTFLAHVIQVTLCFLGQQVVAEIEALDKQSHDTFSPLLLFLFCSCAGDDQWCVVQSSMYTIRLVTLTANSVTVSILAQALFGRQKHNSKPVITTCPASCHFNTVSYQVFSSCLFLKCLRWARGESAMMEAVRQESSSAPKCKRGESCSCSF